MRIRLFSSRNPSLLLPVVGGLLLVTGFVALLLLVRQSVESTRWVEHTLQVKNALGALLSTVQDAETGQRGYLITGNETYLAPYQSAVENVAPRLDELAALTSDNPTQQADIAELRTAISARIEVLRQGIDIARTGNGARAIRSAP